MSRLRSGGPSAPEDGAIHSVYQALNDRYASNTTLQWQIPLYAIPAQAALFVGIATSEGLLSLLLGLLAVAIGFIGAVVMRRIELTARWDRQLLDVYEKRLLPDDISLRLLHDESFKTRLNRRKLKSSASSAKRVELRLMGMFPPSLTVMLLLISVGLFAAVVGFAHSRDGAGLAPIELAPHSVLVEIGEQYSDDELKLARGNYEPEPISSSAQTCIESHEPAIEKPCQRDVLSIVGSAPAELLRKIPDLVSEPR